jgi:hypothetical protein
MIFFFTAEVTGTLFRPVTEPDLPKPLADVTEVNFVSFCLRPFHQIISFIH